MKSATWSIHSMYCFLSSMQCCLTVFYHSRTLSKLDSIISNLATVFPNKFLEHSKSYAIISTIFLASSLAIDPTARKQFCSFCLWLFFSSIQVLSYDYRNWFAVSSSFAMPTTYAVTPVPEVLNPWEESLRAGTTLFHGPLMCCYFSSSSELDLGI